jgi:hypothetical protein
MFVFILRFLAELWLGNAGVGCGLDGPHFVSLLRQDIFLFSKTSRTTLKPTQPPIIGYWGVLPGRQVNHSPPSEAEVKNGWSCTSTPTIAWIGRSLLFFYFEDVCGCGRLIAHVLSVGTRWTVRGSNPCRSEIFCICPDRPWDPSILLYNGYRFSFPAVKRPERGVDHTSPSSAEVKERIELYL